MCGCDDGRNLAFDNADVRHSPFDRPIVLPLTKLGLIMTHRQQHLEDLPS